MSVAPPTHEVLNQAPPLVGHNVFEVDPALVEGLSREGGAWGVERVRAIGALAGSPETHEHSRRAERNEPRLLTHDRFGNRIDEIELDPSWHWLLRHAIEGGMAGLPWSDPVAGAHVVRASMFMLWSQISSGVMCPVSMTYAGVPAIRANQELAEQWEPRLIASDYDNGALCGMAMTEKQGGSDVRANTTVAVEAGDGTYSITGHKWFCSYPPCDVFLTLAQTDAGLSCFLVEPGPGFHIQRLKDKLGTRSLPSSEVEFADLEGRLVGEEGRGVPTIIEMVNHTRLDCILGTTAGMRRAVSEAVNHCRGRRSFGAYLSDHPAMRNVLADLALESEAATATALRIARAYDEPGESSFRRLATAVSKYWICKRGPGVAVEALECFGGNGYVEESPMPQIYRDIELNSIWEGSGNVAALDVLRAIGREPETLAALLAECRLAQGSNAHLDHHLSGIEDKLGGLASDDPQWYARRVVEELGVALQGSLLVRNAPAAVSDAFCASRLGGRAGRAYGTLEQGVDAETIIERALAL
ncbi:MAG: acyl-CoA dehydrogenase family protein [Thermoleophilaceae bacterium]|nr:acyl-CoA dehydrogenase family protein [Thermoleophilaceae bacterium]